MYIFKQLPIYDHSIHSPAFKVSILTLSDVSPASTCFIKTLTPFQGGSINCSRGWPVN